MATEGGMSGARVLVTGAAGYIGSHAVQRLVRDGAHVLAVDNLSRGNRAAIDLLAQDSGDRLTFVQADVGDRDAMGTALNDHPVDAALHFAAYAYVGESVTQPLTYYRNNTAQTIGLLESLAEAGVEKLVFSSTCATYGEPEQVPIVETCPQSPVNPYGESKLMVEHVLRDFAAACAINNTPFGYTALRYFNVAGSDRTGLIGEDHEPETHLIPILLQVALGKRESVTIFGDDYATPDGTCIRDYIHVEDLIDAHLAALRAIKPGAGSAYNLGIGKGYSVREVIDATREVTGHEIPAVDGPRRAGDPPMLYADASKIRGELGWSASIPDLHEIIGSAWRWFSKHPNGYASVGERNGVGV